MMPRGKSNRLASYAAFLAISFAANTSRASGVWRTLTNQPGFGVETALLLTDGTVMAHAFDSEVWMRLTPDATGSYLGGTWSRPASLPTGYRPYYFGSAVLPDGRLIVEGGEYNGVVDSQGNLVAVETNLGAIFDPLLNTWTPVTGPTVAYIGDASTVVLPNGTFMLAMRSTYQTLLNASNRSWTSTGAGKADSNDEEGWTLLPNGKVLTIDTGNGTQSELYDPTTGQWSTGGSTGNALAAGGETGPAVLLPDGRVFVVGALGNTAFYSPSGVWTAGPNLPLVAEGQLNGADTPAVLLPNGHVLFAAGFFSPAWKKGVHFLEFDGANLVDVGAPAGNAASFAYTERLLLLPSGEVLLTDGTNPPMIFLPNGSPNPAWAPTVSSFPTVVRFGSTQRITGTQFNGLSQAVAYGDDVQAATNYPLVRITHIATGQVRYARTHDHSTMAVATGTLPVSTMMDVPFDVKTGPSLVQVVANGIASSAQATCIAQDVATTCAASCGGTFADGCGSTTCPKLTGLACCGHLGGSWQPTPSPGHCVFF
jgi:hypothetical protein